MPPDDLDPPRTCIFTSRTRFGPSNCFRARNANLRLRGPPDVHFYTTVPYIWHFGYRHHETNFLNLRVRSLVLFLCIARCASSHETCKRQFVCIFTIQIGHRSASRSTVGLEAHPPGVPLSLTLDTSKARHLSNNSRVSTFV